MLAMRWSSDHWATSAGLDGRIQVNEKETTHCATSEEILNDEGESMDSLESVEPPRNGEPSEMHI